MAYKLLLADDSITIQKVVELVLAEEDFQIKSVSNGEEALNLLETFRPDIVLADIEMPKVNGYNLCERIKKNPATSHVPVILLAGAFEPLDEELAEQVGADDTVIKPFESQELISKMNAALAMVSAEAEEGIESAEEEVLEAVEEEDMFAEAEAVGVESAEAAATEGSEEDLWSMEDVSEVAEEPVEEAFPEEEGFDKTFDVIEEEAPLAVPELKQAPVVEEKIVRPAAGGPVMADIDMPTKDEFLRLFEKVVDKKIEVLLSQLNIREALLSALMPSMKDAVEKVLWEVAPELAESIEGNSEEFCFIPDKGG